MNYQLIPNSPDGSPSNTIRRMDDGVTIPLDPDNLDYQKYLKWLDEGNTPEPADE